MCAKDVHKNRKLFLSKPLVSLDFPWDKSKWQDPQKGYTRTKDFFAFKQFSSFVHPGWKRVNVTINQNDGKGLAFINGGKDSISFIVVNRSEGNSLEMNLCIPGYSINESQVYITSETKNCKPIGSLVDSVFTVAPHSIATAAMRISQITSAVQTNKRNFALKTINCNSNYPNPFSHSTAVEFFLTKVNQLRLPFLIFKGEKLINILLGLFSSGKNWANFKRNGLSEGLYFYQLRNSKGEFGTGRFIIQD